MRRFGLLLPLAVAGMLAAGASPATPGAGTRARPFSMHVASPVRGATGWRVRVDSVALDANAAIAAESPLNKPPKAGHQYVLVDMTITFAGARATKTTDGLVFYAVGRSNTLYDFQLDACGLAPRLLDDLKPLRRGRSVSGALCVDVKKADVATLLFVVEPAQLLPGKARTFFRMH